MDELPELWRELRRFWLLLAYFLVQCFPFLVTLRLSIAVDLSFAVVHPATRECIDELVRWHGLLMFVLLKIAVFLFLEWTSLRWNNSSNRLVYCHGWFISSSSHAKFLDLFEHATSESCTLGALSLSDGDGWSIGIAMLIPRGRLDALLIGSLLGSLLLA